MSIHDIMAKVDDYRPHWVTVTGGEPLAQPGAITLLKALCDVGYEVSLETSGALDVSAVDSRVVKVLDLKTPGSAEVERNRFENIEFLTQQDQVKFVICDKNDYSWAKQIMEKYGLAQRCEILFSPSYTQCKAKDLAEWILQDRLPVRLQIQLHKYLWGDEPGR